MSRLTIDISPEQHRSLKAMAALEGKTIRQFALERLFPARPAKAEDWGEEAFDREAASADWPLPSDFILPDIPGGIPEDYLPISFNALLDKAESGEPLDRIELAVWAAFTSFLEGRVAEANAGQFTDETIDEIFERVLREEGHEAG